MHVAEDMDDPTEGCRLCPEEGLQALRGMLKGFEVTVRDSNLSESEAVDLAVPGRKGKLFEKSGGLRLFKLGFRGREKL